MSAQRQIAEDATFQIEVALTYIEWLKSVLSVVHDRLEGQEENKRYADLTEMAISSANRWHSELNDERESLDKRAEAAFADGSAPQNSNLVVRGAEVSQ